MIKRWIIRSVFILPILLCLGGWAWSTDYTMGLRYSTTTSALWCNVNYGVVFLGYDDPPAFEWSGGPWDWHCEDVSFRWVPPDFFHASCHASDYSFVGFAYHHDDRRGLWEYPWCFVAVPFWFLLLVSVGALVFVWRKTRPKINPQTAFPVEISNPK